MSEQNHKTRQIFSIVVFLASVFIGLLLVVLLVSELKFVGAIIFLVGIFVAALLFLSSSKTTKKPREVLDNFRENTQTPFNQLYRSRENNPSSSVIIEKPVKRIRIKSFFFELKHTNPESIFICMICKLQLRNKQLVYQCTQCKSYFHEEHLNEWLNDNNDCPVCNYILKSF